MAKPSQPSEAPGVATGTSRQPAARRVRLNSVELFAGAREVVIAHGGDEYRLRMTRQDKLILTK